MIFPTKNVFLIIGIAIASGYIGYQLASYQAENNDNNLITSPEATLTEIKHLHTENKRLQELLEQQQLNANLQSVSTHTSSRQKITLQEEKADTKKLQNNESPSNFFDASHNFSQWLSQSNKSSDFDLNNEMKTRFEAEDINPLWAEEKTEFYYSLFIENENLSGFALKNTECRSTQCAITVGITNIEQANILIEKLSASLQQQKKYPLIVSTPDAAQGISTLYIRENAANFEINSTPAVN